MFLFFYFLSFFKLNIFFFNLFVFFLFFIPLFIFFFCIFSFFRYASFNIFISFFLRIKAFCFFKSFFSYKRIGLVFFDFMFFYCVFCFLAYLFSLRCKIEFCLWFSFGDFLLHWDFYFSVLSVTMCLLVFFITSMVLLFSTWYLRHETFFHFTRFLLFITFFSWSMNIMVLSGNFIVFFFGWEFVGLFSFLLINFWFSRIEANKAALKAVLVNKFSDVCLYFGILLFFFFYKTFDFNIFFEYLYKLDNTFFLYANTFICFFLLIGAVGKSSQIGLHYWLPDAMEGPTPVSSLLHAATMVTAGVYLLIRLNYLFSHCADFISLLIFLIGFFTVLFSVTISLFQFDLKKILAYSTMCQIGFMFISCGVSCYNLAFFHLIVHAFYKCCLFLSSGVIIELHKGEQDIRKMSGFIFMLNPFIFFIFFLSTLSLIGLPLTSGFYSKEHIILMVENWLVFKHIPIFFFSLLWISAFAYIFIIIRCFFFLSRTKRFADNRHFSVFYDKTFADCQWQIPLYILCCLQLFCFLPFFRPFFVSFFPIHNIEREVIAPLTRGKFSLFFFHVSSAIKEHKLRFQRFYIIFSDSFLNTLYFFNSELLICSLYLFFFKLISFCQFFLYLIFINYYIIFVFFVHFFFVIFLIKDFLISIVILPYILCMLICSIFFKSVFILYFWGLLYISFFSVISSGVIFNIGFEQFFLSFSSVVPFFSDILNLLSFFILLFKKVIICFLNIVIFNNIYYFSFIVSMLANFDLLVIFLAIIHVFVCSFFFFVFYFMKIMFFNLYFYPLKLFFSFFILFFSNVAKVIILFPLIPYISWVFSKLFYIFIILFCVFIMNYVEFFRFIASTNIYNIKNNVWAFNRVSILLSDFYYKTYFLTKQEIFSLQVRNCLTILSPFLINKILLVYLVTTQFFKNGWFLEVFVQFYLVWRFIYLSFYVYFVEIDRGFFSFFGFQGIIRSFSWLSSFLYKQSYLFFYFFFFSFFIICLILLFC